MPICRKGLIDAEAEVTALLKADPENLQYDLDGNPLSDGQSYTTGQTYLWGLDISEQQGSGPALHSSVGAAAGGIGGLIAIKQGNNTLLPAYDGHGNVMALVDADTGEIVAEYEYSPFGETIRATGPMADRNPFRFSTKYTDAETGLVYFGYRFYSPDLGRWLNRDPIEEQGGLNLYVMVFNNPLTYIDGLGAAPLIPFVAKSLSKSIVAEAAKEATIGYLASLIDGAILLNEMRLHCQSSRNKWGA